LHLTEFAFSFEFKDCEVDKLFSGFYLFIFAAVKLCTLHQSDVLKHVMKIVCGSIGESGTKREGRCFKSASNRP